MVALLSRDFADPSPGQCAESQALAKCLHRRILDRAASRGFRLDIPAGTAVRFEPGDAKTVGLVALAGRREVYGLANAVNGPLDA